MGKFGQPWKGEVHDDKFTKKTFKYDPVTNSAQPVKKNKRVNNARKVTNLAGEQFDSGLEMFMDGLLSKSGITYERQKVFILQEAFRETQTGNWIREIKWIVDFYLPSISTIIDTKGWATEVFTLKYKIFQHNRHIGLYKEILEVKFAKNQNQCVLVLSETKALIRDKLT